MIAAGIKTPVPLEELESHLREEIERQTKSGTNEEQAFTLAAERIGNGENLQKEFRKVEVDTKLKKYKLVIRFIQLFGAFLPSCILAVMFSEWRAGKIEMSPGEFLLELGAVVAPIFFVLVARRFARLLPVTIDGRLQAAALLGPFVLGFCLWEWVCNFLVLDSLAHFQIVGSWMMALSWGFLCFITEWIVRCAAAEAGTANA